MIKGIGIDTVCISDFKTLPEKCYKKMFSGRELAVAESKPDRYEYLAGRYAAKEAVFKAVPGEFDFRGMTISNHDDGSPYVIPDTELADAMAKAGIQKILLSITTENEYVTAIAAAQ